MTQEQKKAAAARAALEHVAPGSIVGVGTGSTTNHFIDGLAGSRDRIEAAVASSQATARRLEAGGVRVIDLNEAGRLTLYVDGADEADSERRLIKGGGGALTREKIIAAASDRFLCIIDDSKLVKRLGRFPLPVEVIPIARAYVAAAIENLGGRPRRREDFVTENGNWILDVHDLPLADAEQMEASLNQIAGVVSNGLFCKRPADLLLVGEQDGVREL